MSYPPLAGFLLATGGNEMVMFKWHTAGEKPCFHCVRWSGKVFASLNEVPDLPVHENCKCFIEAIPDPKSKALLDKAGKEISNMQQGVDTALASIVGYSLSPWFASNVLSAVKRLWSDMEQFSKTLEIFWDNFNKMKEADTIGADKYFHSKANAEAAQLGPTGEAVAEFISSLREVTDFWKYLLRDKMKVEDIIEDMNKDLEANAYGREAGRNNPDTPAEDLVDIYRPNGLDEKY